MQLFCIKWFRKLVFWCSNRHSTGRGFTLPELLITTSILILVSAATLVSMNTSTAERQMEQATEELTLTVAQARSLALAPPLEKSVGNAGYRLTLVADPIRADLATSYEIREIGSLPGVVPATSSNILVREGVFAPKIGYTVVSGGALPSLTFSISGQGRIIDPKPSDGLIHLQAITKTGTAVTRSVTISTITGQVDVTNP